MLMSIIKILVIAAIIYVLLKTVKVFRIILTVVLGVIYIPINTFNVAVQKWYFGMRHKDEIIYYAFTPFYWIIVGITFIISIPYEFVIAMDLH